VHLSKDEAQREAIRRWYELPADMRQTPDDCELFAEHIAPQLDFDSVTSRERLLAAWLMRELFRTSEAQQAKEAEAAAKTQAA
jgi:hypothetical protein